MGTRTDRDQFIPDRRIIAALDQDDRVEAIRELVQEAWNKGYSAGQMKARLAQPRGTW